jgi:hypothetical protein
MFFIIIEICISLRRSYNCFTTQINNPYYRSTISLAGEIVDECNDFVCNSTNISFVISSTNEK